MEKKTAFAEGSVGLFLFKENCCGKSSFACRSLWRRPFSEAKTQCFEWFQRFKSVDFHIKDKERTGQPKKFENEELETLLDEYSCQTQDELAKSLEVT